MVKPNLITFANPFRNGAHLQPNCLCAISQFRCKGSESTKTDKISYMDCDIARDAKVRKFVPSFDTALV